MTCLLAGMLLTGSMLLVPVPVAADPSDGFIVSESLRRKSQGLPPRYAPPTTKSDKYQGNTYVTPRGSVLHRYKYKSPSGRTYKGTIKSLRADRIATKAGGNDRRNINQDDPS